MTMDTLVLTNARFYTFNPDQPIAERLIIQNRKIIAAGSADDISLDSFPKAEIFDLQWDDRSACLYRFPYSPA